MDVQALDGAAREFLDAVVATLTAERVLPTPIYNPYIYVGYDYFGGSIMGTPQFERLAALIQASHPRFEEPVTSRDWDSPNSYMFSLIESFIVLSHRLATPTNGASESADIAISHLLAAIADPGRKVAACRVVTHLTTFNEKPFHVAGVTVHPIGGEPHENRRRVAGLIDAVIPGASGATRADPPGGFGPPDSVVVARSGPGDPYAEASAAHRLLTRFMLLCRLLKGGTATSQYEVQGETAWGGKMRPHVFALEGRADSMQMYERLVQLKDEDKPSFDGLSALLEACEGPPAGMALTSFGMALHKFEVSHGPRPWWERIVDLATAFEACLSGTATTDIVLRICTRAAGLLVTPDDPAATIFSDIRGLYGLRSKLVHGGSMKERELIKLVKGLSAVPEAAPPGVALEYAVDRMRDFVRRGLLMRMCLATAETGGRPYWPLGDDAGVDAALADDSKRSDWRSTWRAKLAEFGASDAGNRAAPLADIFTGPRSC